MRCARRASTRATRTRRPARASTGHSSPNVSAHCAKETPLIVWRLDRLGRSVKDLVALIKELRERGVEFVSLTEAIDTTTPMGSFIFHITDREWRAIRTLVDARELTITEIAAQYRVSPATVYRRRAFQQHP